MNLEVSLVIGSFVTLLFFIVGILIGWTAREYMKNYREIPSQPEMFDMQGNLIPDEIVAFNFENYHDSENSEEDETQTVKVTKTPELPRMPFAFEI